MTQLPQELLSHMDPLSLPDTTSTSAGIIGQPYQKAYGVFICSALDMLAVVADNADDPKDRMNADRYMLSLSIADKNVLYPKDFISSDDKILVNLLLLAGRLGADVDNCTSKILELVTGIFDESDEEYGRKDAGEKIVPILCAHALKAQRD